MRIAVIADTHNRLPSSVRNAIAGADEIWHLGDICTRELLAELRGLGPPVHAIRGNCDPRGLAPETLFLERGGSRFFLVHEPPHAAPDGVDCVLHGHTHVPRDEKTGPVRFLNPGAVGKANHGAPTSFAWMEVDEAGKVRWQVVPVLWNGDRHPVFLNPAPVGFSPVALRESESGIEPPAVWLHTFLR